MLTTATVGERRDKGERGPHLSFLFSPSSFEDVLTVGEEIMTLSTFGRGRENNRCFLSLFPSEKCARYMRGGGWSFSAWNAFWHFFKLLSSPSCLLSTYRSCLCPSFPLSSFPSLFLPSVISGHHPAAISPFPLPPPPPPPPPPPLKHCPTATFATT